MEREGEETSRGDYFRDKIQKLQSIQEDTTVFSDDIISNIFESCYVYINGATFPPVHELRRLLRSHGAVCEGYPVPRLTHIVCDFLTEAQIKQYNAKTHSVGDRSKVLHVTVAWVLESIRLKKRQPEILFQTAGINAEKDGQNLSRFFINQRQQQQDKTETISRTTDDMATPIIHQELIDEPEDGEYVSDILAVHETSSSVLPQLIASAGHDDHNSNSRTPIPSTYQPLHSTTLTSEHPDFLKQYFSRSRLSFIGRWRNRVPLIANKFNPQLRKSGTGSGSGALGHGNSAIQNRLHYPQPSVTSSSSSSAANMNAILRSPSSLQDSRGDRVVVHVDMDCFFVSALTRHRPDLARVPVAVAHSASAGSSEISSCNYPARRRGLSSGMFMSKARTLCPELVVLPYDFDLYTELSEKLYSVLYSSSALIVEPVSVDEAYLEFASGTDGMAVATQLRAQIFDVTQGCTASAGVGSNMLLARLATKKAKPNGQFQLCCPSAGIDVTSVRRKLSMCDDDPPEDEDNYRSVDDAHNQSDKNQSKTATETSDKTECYSGDQVTTLLSTMPVADIPGVGYHLVAKLDEKQIKFCQDLWDIPKSRLEEWFGASTGTLLWEASRGIDNRALQPVESPKSIGAEVNWALRFSDKSKSEEFLLRLVDEISSRLVNAEKKGRTVTVKLKVKRAGSGDPRKFLGHGICDNLSKSCTVNRSVYTGKDIYALALPLYRELMRSVPVEDLRGMGATVSKLEDLHLNSTIPLSPSRLSSLSSSSLRSIFPFAAAPNATASTATPASAATTALVVQEQSEPIGVIDLSATQEDVVTKVSGDRIMNHNNSTHQSSLATLPILDDFLQAVPRELHEEVKAQLRAATGATSAITETNSKPLSSSSLAIVSKAAKAHPKTHSTLLKPSTNKKRKHDMRSDGKHVASTDSNQMILDLVHDPDASNSNSNSNSRSHSHWALRPSRAATSPVATSNILTGSFMSVAEKHLPQQVQVQMESHDTYPESTSIWRNESLVVIADGIKSWFRDISDLNRLGSLDDTLEYPTHRLLGFKPGVLQTDDIHYLCQYTEWLCSRQQFDVAESYVCLVLRSIEQVVTELRTIEKLLPGSVAHPGANSQSSYKFTGLAQTQSQSQSQNQSQNQSQLSLFAQVQARISSQSSLWDVPPRKHDTQKQYSAIPTMAATIEEEEDTHLQGSVVETMSAEALSGIIHTWKNVAVTIQSHHQSMLTRARKNMFI